LTYSNETFTIYHFLYDLIFFQTKMNSIRRHAALSDARSRLLKIHRIFFFNLKQLVLDASYLVVHGSLGILWKCGEKMDQPPIAQWQ
jgi:hypothetical protein